MMTRGQVLMLCLRCGKREQFSDNICEKCIIDTVKPIVAKPVVHGSVCPSCNRIQRGKSWDDCTGDLTDAACQIAFRSLSIEENIRSPHIELSVDHYDSNTFKISGETRSNYKGVFIDQKINTEVRITLNQCPFCSKQSGNYFEAIIQIRGLDGLSEKEVDDLLFYIEDQTEKTSLKDPNVFITKIEKVRGGYDFYMGENTFSKQFSQKLHDTYGGEHKWSSSLFGRREGRDIYRHTYLVRLPGFVVGDYLLRDDEPLKVKKIAKKVSVHSLKTDRELSIELSEAMSFRKLKKDDVEIDLIVVSHSDDEVQVLHPTTMRTVDLLLQHRIVQSETIPGALIEGELYLV
jgi:nonsense-mediated mRNA decay protein 3